MTLHLDEGVLQALLDGELEGETARATREHLAGCPVCRQRYADAREANAVLTSALAWLDPVAVGTGGALAAPPSIRARTARWGRQGLARAAVMVLTVAAAASATIPGSPVRRWLFEREGAAPTAGAAADRTTAIATPPASAPAESGVSVAADAGRFEVLLTGVGPELRVRARLVDGSRGAVVVAGDEPAPRFGTAPGSIRVDGARAGELRVDIPRGAASAAVLVDGRVYLVKEGEQLRLLPSDSAAPAEILFQVSP